MVGSGPEDTPDPGRQCRPLNAPRRRPLDHFSGADLGGHFLAEQTDRHVGDYMSDSEIGY